MSPHTKEQFDIFMSQLKETNTTLGFYCDFEKIRDNVESISIKLNQLNYLIGQADMDAAIRRLWNENKNVFSTPIKEGVVVMKQLQHFCEVCKECCITALQIFIHRDEGHYGVPGDAATWKPNLHAHII